MAKKKRLAKTVQTARLDDVCLAELSAMTGVPLPTLIRCDQLSLLDKTIALKLLCHFHYMERSGCICYAKVLQRELLPFICNRIGLSTELATQLLTDTPFDNEHCQICGRKLYESVKDSCQGLCKQCYTAITNSTRKTKVESEDDDERLKL